MSTYIIVARPDILHNQLYSGVIWGGALPPPRIQNWPFAPPQESEKMRKKY